MDDADFTTTLLARQQDAMKNVGPVNLAGPDACSKCGDDNDRAAAGFAVCSACMEAGA